MSFEEMLASKRIACLQIKRDIPKEVKQTSWEELN